MAALRDGAALRDSSRRQSGQIPREERRIIFDLLTVALGVVCSAPAMQALPDPLPDLAVGPQVVRLEVVVSDLVFPTDVAAPPDGSPRVFVNQVDGFVRVIEDGVLLASPFVDLSAEYQPSNGSAMSSIAFHPDFSENRKLYVIMSELKDPALGDFGVTDGVLLQSVLYELRAGADHPDPGSNLADARATRELLRINEQSVIHNLDDLAFGPDGYLYVSKGDDVTGGQDTTTIHGSVLRIDVDFRPGNPVSANGQYAIPADNPFSGGGGGVVPEIYAYGLRNPWRISFDRTTGDLWVADVGQADIEEVDRVVAGGNYGWDEKEGAFATVDTGGVTDDLSGLPPGPFIDPVGQYDHGEQDLSVTGGVVYGGASMPQLMGSYVCGDWKSGRLFLMDLQTGQLGVLPVDPAGDVINGQFSGEPAEGVISIAEDADGELLIVVTQRNLTPTGRVLRVETGTWVDLGDALDGVSGAPLLAGSGSLGSGTMTSLTLSGAAPASLTTLVIGATPLGSAFKGGVMVPALDVLFQGLPTGPAGDLVLAGPWPPGIPPGVSLYFQHWIVDAAGPQGLAASNALRGTTP